MPFGQRLKALLERYETRQEASQIARVNPDQLAKYVAGAAKPDFETVARLAKKKDVSLDWLATGEGMSESGAVISAQGFMTVDMWPKAAYSGRGVFAVNGEETSAVRVAVPFVMFKGMEIPVADLCAVLNRGGANTPELNDGDTLIVNRSEDRISSDGFYIFEDDGLLLVRVVERRMGGSVSVRVRDGSAEPQLLSRDEVSRLNVFGRVGWRLGAI
jgi:phage repressor protein C with HTH and peptisase S24 domain